ncbi:hypothetical protein PQR34_44030 [Paraburkholderia sediminicola]|uniref:hypothetical protein n=1 Tax=Paraburkholderia sediminicola TaxID=458836 RepID=UPI0038B92977
MKRATEIAELTLKILSCIAILGAGGWAVWVFWLGGATDWQANVAIDAQVLPYHDDLRLLVVHVKAKNPRSTTFELESKAHDSYALRVRRIAADGKTGAVFHEDQGDVLASVDLLAQVGGDYEFVPGAEMDDMETIVLPVGTTVALTAEMQMHTGSVDEHGKPDYDTNSASTVVNIAP